MQLVYGAWKLRLIHRSVDAFGPCAKGEFFACVTLVEQGQTPCDERDVRVCICFVFVEWISSLYYQKQENILRNS